VAIDLVVLPSMRNGHASSLAPSKLKVNQLMFLPKSLCKQFLNQIKFSNSMTRKSQNVAPRLLFCSDTQTQENWSLKHTRAFIVANIFKRHLNILNSLVRWVMKKCCFFGQRIGCHDKFVSQRASLLAQVSHEMPRS